jgi:uncharacterized membrane protein
MSEPTQIKVKYLEDYSVSSYTEKIYIVPVLRRAKMKKLVTGILVTSFAFGMFLGCATTGLITTGITALGIIDSFYESVVAKKSVPNTLQAATLILQQADALAQMAKAGKNTSEMVAQALLLQSQADKLVK